MVLERPSWLKKRLPLGRATKRMEQELMTHCVHTICQEACCPNQGECFSKGIATFLIMGDICTRDCRFCAVKRGVPAPLDKDEPMRLAREVSRLGLRFVVITSVTRDDLPDGGAGHFAKTIRAVQELCRGIGIEVLTPDFKGSKNSLKRVVDAKPEVFNHNVETVPRLYPAVRPQADYRRSLRLIEAVKKIDNRIVTKSGLMVGLGERKKEIVNVMYDLRQVGCDLITIGQYLSPSRSHYPVARYVRPEDFEEYREIALEMGFKGVASSPFVRSSYMAEKYYTKALAQFQEHRIAN
ncbi:MAG: lipoyl synthase [Deltaproteobacteria bacterium]|nr:lipoyl synthase [Deltaproteobacteria bacterium]MBW2025334.1 lipoyl synthase [Deltaproteobacteria bacterium]MBW2125201.1 lipoyl synthase [Deltaproteobacteria bacterium]